MGPGGKCNGQYLAHRFCGQGHAGFQPVLRIGAGVSVPLYVLRFRDLSAGADGMISAISMIFGNAMRLMGFARDGAGAFGR